MSERVTCDKCGMEYGIGASPWCRDQHAQVAPEPGFEPYEDWNLTTDPVWIDSRSTRQRIMRENGLEYRPKAKAPGKTLYFT